MVTLVIKYYGQHSSQGMIKYSSCLALVECMTVGLSDVSVNVLALTHL